MRTTATADVTMILRAMRGSYTQAQVAERLGVAQNTLSTVESGADGRTPEVMRHYVDAYGQVLLSQLLDAGDDWRFVALRVCAVARIEPQRWTGPAEVVQAVTARIFDVLGAGAS